MSEELLRLYQQLQTTPAMTADFPAEAGQGHITSLETTHYSLSEWNMEFNKDTPVEGCGGKDMRLLFCMGDGVEWISDRGTARLDHNEACFYLPDGSSEKMCYQGHSPFSFLSVSIPEEQFAGILGEHFAEPAAMMKILDGRPFPITTSIRECLQKIRSLDSVHTGFEMMRLDARLLENMSFCLEAALCGPVNSCSLHKDDLKAVYAIREGIDRNPAAASDISTLAREYCMSSSKLARAFRRVCGVPLHAYVIEARLQKGIELLAQDSMPIREIAERIGYAKPSQFSADFRKRFGILPREYRMRS